MSNRLVWHGLAELRRALLALPADLTAEAAVIARERAGAAETAIRSGYPVRTGRLARGVTVETSEARGRFSVTVHVVNTNPLAHIFEHGTAARHTKIGANRGAMPPGHVFFPAYERERDAMYDELRALLVAHGLAVRGAP